MNSAQASWYPRSPEIAQTAVPPRRLPGTPGPDAGHASWYPHARGGDRDRVITEFRTRSLPGRATGGSGEPGEPRPPVARRRDGTPRLGAVSGYFRLGELLGILAALAILGYWGASYAVDVMRNVQETAGATGSHSRRQVAEIDRAASANPDPAKR